MTTGTSLGDVYDPLGEHRHDPYPFFARARDTEPVFWSPVVNAWVLTRYEDIHYVLRNHDLFSSANALRPLRPLPPATVAVMREGYPLDPPGILVADGETHMRLRTPAARGLSPSRVAAAEPFIRQKAGSLIDAFAGDGEGRKGGKVELMSQYAHRLPISTIAHMCAMDPEDEQAVYTGSYEVNKVNFLDLPEDEQVEAAREGVKLHKIAGKYLHARRAEPGDDLISEIVTALAPPAGEPLPFPLESQIARTIVTLLIAGHMTTSAIIGASVRYPLSDRKQWELLRERPELIGAAVEEAARYDTPTHAFLRRATREVTLGGRMLPEGSEILVVYPAANRDPALCERPDEFDLTRKTVRHVGFGTGVHACVGAQLGRRQAEITLEILLRRLPGLRLASDQTFPMTVTLNLRSLAELRLEW